MIPFINPLGTYGLGWRDDAGIHLLRIVLAGALDRLPHLQDPRPLKRSLDGRC